MCSRPLSLFVLTLLAPALAAQATRVVPAGVTHEEGNAQSFFPFVLTGGRVQQITAASEIARASSVLREFAFRPEGTSTVSFPARSYARFILTVGQTSVTPAAMKTTFASNRGTTMTKLFDAAFNAPAQPPVSSAPTPFNIKLKLSAPFVFVAARGNLVWEIEIPGSTSRRVAYFVDAQIGTSGGSTMSFGQGGQLKNKDNYMLKSDEARLVPGKSADLTVTGLGSMYPTLAMIGFSNSNFGPITLPFDLTGLGAPGNSLYVSMDLVAPMTLSGSGGSYMANVSVPLPGALNLNGLALFGQALFVDKPSNALGLVFSEAVEMVVGSNTSQPSNAVAAYDSTATSGSFAIRVNTNPNPGGIVVQWTGTFN